VTDSERIAILETQYKQIEEDNREIKGKLDDLLTLRNKGVGAFWLASALLGTGIVGALLQLIDWMKGTH
jgi:hypothetical protein